MEELNNKVFVEKEKDKNNEKLFEKGNIYILISSLLLGILLDLLFYGKGLGISYPIFILAFYAAVIAHSQKKLVLRFDFGWLLSIPVLMLSLAYVLFSNEMFMVLNFMAVPALVVSQTLLITHSNKYEWHTQGFIADILYGFVSYTFGNIAKPYMLLAGIIRKKTNPGKYDTVKKVLVGLVISIPLLLVIISLLASADQVFEHFVGEIPEFLENINMGEFTVRAIIVLCAATLIFGYIWSLAGHGAERGVEKLAYTRSLHIVDAVTVVTVLAAINIIYVFFTIIQFSYLFGGITYKLPPNFTHAVYARRGFFELVAVTIINFSVLLGFITFTKRGGVVIQRIIRVLYTLLVLCTLVMLFSAHFRMALYEEAYGYTYLRMLTHSFMVFLFVLLVLALYRIWWEGFSLVKPYIVIAVIAYLMVNYINIDSIIARNNINRYAITQDIDVDYLEGLSYDAVDEITRLLDSEDEVIAGKARNLLYKKREQLAKRKPWQSFNLSEYRAEKLLAGYELYYNQEYEDRYANEKAARKTPVR